MNMNSIVKNISLVSNIKGFQNFVDGMSKMPPKISVNVESILREEWIDLERSEKIKLGKAIMSAIKTGTLNGIEADLPIAGKAQTYKRVGEVELKTIFSAPLWGTMQNMSEVLSLNSQLSSNWIYVKCYKSSDDIFKCVFLDTKGNSICEEFQREIPQAFFEKNEVSGTNAEFRAIIALWYGFDRVFENAAFLQHKGINSICFLAPNEQMMNRIAAEKFDTANNIYCYTDFIQKHFSDFKNNGLRELPFRYGIYALPNSELNK